MAIRNDGSCGPARRAQGAPSWGASLRNARGTVPAGGVGRANEGNGGVLPVDVVPVRERGERADALNWVLLGSEPVQEIEQVKRIVRYYELRWRMRNITKSGKAAWAWSDCANQARRTWSG